MRYHLGCGEQHLDGYVNVDVRSTQAADVVMDLNEPVFPSGEPVDGVFSNAFFEHLRRDSRIPHLRAVRRALGDDGFACYAGLPDFRRVAELYLTGGPGVVGAQFDLFNVYRYTHGDPEMFVDDEGWIAQVHKSLFDVGDLGRLLRDAGFASYVVFRYVYPGDPPEIDLTIGFYASPRNVPEAELQDAASRFLLDFDGRVLDHASLRFEDGRSRPAAVARLGSFRQRKLLQRVAYGIASVLARNSHPA